MISKSCNISSLEMYQQKIVEQCRRQQSNDQEGRCSGRMLGSSHRLAITLNKALNPCEPQVPCVNGNNEQVVKTAKWVKIGTGMPLKSHLLQLLQLVTSSVNWIHERNGFIFQISLGALRKNLVHLKLKAYWPVKSINVSNDGENEHTYIQFAENKIN